MPRGAETKIRKDAGRIDAGGIGAPTSRSVSMPLGRENQAAQGRRRPEGAKEDRCRGIVTTEDAALRRVLVRQGTTKGRLVGAGPRTPPDRSVYAIRGATKGGTAAVP
jgi:hypothetical protein